MSDNAGSQRRRGEREERPTPDEIRAACLAIQSGWSPEERLRRLRWDLRPVVLGADRLKAHDMTAADYETHENRGELQEEPT